MLSQAEVQAALLYDEKMGEFFKKDGRGPVGYIQGGYRVIRLGGHRYGAHRLAWVYMHGVWPDAEIDHRNGRRLDNRISNLRPATQSENQQNRRHAKEGSASGYLGVSKAGNRWAATIYVNRKKTHLGNFKDAAEAHAAYLVAKRLLHPTCTI